MKGPLAWSLCWLGGVAAAAAAPAAAPAAVPAPTSDALRFYRASDFDRIDKIDAHVHIHGSAERFMALAMRDRVRILTINVDYSDFPPLPDQQRDAISLHRRYPRWVAFAASFGVQDFDAPDFNAQDWAMRTIAQLDDARRQGAVGVKIWKNIGMSLRDPDGRYVMLDDPRFEPVLAALEKGHVVLLAHQAEPLNCWLPMDQMTVRSDREYFQQHPQYYMFQHPEMPSRDTILAARDRMMVAHPALRVDALHLASLEWDVDQVAAFLDRFPEADVDLAARLVHLEHQAASAPEKVRAFLLRYQDRILYGSDESYGPEDDGESLATIHAAWVADWRFLTGRESLHSDDFDGTFPGMRLPRSVIDKIYRRNAKRLFPAGWKTSRVAASR